MIKLLLNGPSSSGKSSICKEIQSYLKKHDNLNFLTISIDDYLTFSTDEPIYEDDVFDIIPNMIQDIQNSEKVYDGILIDHVITSHRIYSLLTDTIKDIKTIKVNCPLEELTRRENMRGDRCEGSAENSLEYLYPKTGYDLEINSQDFSAYENSLKIIHHFNLEKTIYFEDGLSLVPYYPCYEKTLVWYQDIQLVHQCDNENTPYDLTLLKQMYNYLSKNGYCYYIALDKEIIGDVTIQFTGEISIVISHEYQNKHIGRKVLNQIISIAKEKKFTRLFANIYSFNTQSQTMFKKCLFVNSFDDEYELLI